MAHGIDHVKTSKYASVQHINTEKDKYGDEQVDLAKYLSVYAVSMKKLL